MTNDFTFDHVKSLGDGWYKVARLEPRARGNGRFVGWVSKDDFGGCDSQASADYYPDESSTCEVTAGQDGTRNIVTAVFASAASGPKAPAPLTVSVTGLGAITTRPAGTVVCENHRFGDGKVFLQRPARVCTPHARPGSTLRLIARPADGWLVGRWRGPCVNQRSPRQTACDLSVGDAGTDVSVLFVRRSR